MSLFNSIFSRLLAFTIAFLLCLAIFPTEASADLILTNNSDPSRTVTIPANMMQDRNARHTAAQSVGCSLHGPGLGSFSGCSQRNTATTPQQPGTGSGQNGSSGLFGGKTYALQLFEFALNGDTCLSCTFLSFFMMALSDFSYMVFQYFYDMFLIIAPLTLAIWLGYRTAKLMVMGGEDGKDFIFGVVSKVALFAVIWIVATGAARYNNYLWEFTGPKYLEYGFSLSNEIRDNALNASSGTSSNASGGGGQAHTQLASAAPVFLCQNISAANNLPSNVSSTGWRYAFIEPALRAGCFTERAHVLGIASGAALAFDSHASNGNLSIWALGAFVLVMVRIMLKVAIGLIVAVTFAVSAIWLIFLTLDIVTRGLITAAFSPILLITYLYKPTRNIATQALRGMVGAVCTAVAIAMINIMAYVLVTNAPKVFMMTYPAVQANMDSWEASENPVTAGENLDPDVDRLEAAYNFVKFIGVGDETQVRIPMNLGSPWFWYLTFSGIAIFGLGRKIIKMIEDIVGYQGAAEFANSSLKSLRMGATVAGGAALLGGAATIGGGMAAGKVLSYGGGAAGRAGASAVQAGRAGFQWAGRQMSNGNVLSASNLGRTAANNLRDEQ